MINTPHKPLRKCRQCFAHRRLRTHQRVECITGTTLLFQNIQSSGPRPGLCCNPGRSRLRRHCQSQIHHQHVSGPEHIGKLRQGHTFNEGRHIVNRCIMLHGFDNPRLRIHDARQTVSLAINRNHIAGFQCNHAGRQGKLCCNTLPPTLGQRHISQHLRQALWHGCRKLHGDFTIARRIRLRLLYCRRTIIQRRLDIAKPHHTRQICFLCTRLDQQRTVPPVFGQAVPRHIQHNT